MTWWWVSIGSVAIVVATVVAAAIAAVVAGTVVATILVVAPPLRIVTLASTTMATIVTRLSLVVVALVILALAPVVAAHLLALCYSNTEPEWLSSQHRTLALLDRLLLLALLSKLDKAVASASQRTVTPPLHRQRTLHTWHLIATYNEKQNIMGIIMVELKLVVLLLT